MEIEQNTNLAEFALCALLGIILIIASACGQSEEEFSATERAQALAQLREAEQTDYTRASDTKAGSVDRADYLVQAQKAEKATRELEHGFNVPPAELDDALAVPREPRSPHQVAVLIRELKKARELDAQGVSDNSVDPVFAQDFAVKKTEANRVINDLEIGEEVPRSEIYSALEVPRNP